MTARWIALATLAAATTACSLTCSPAYLVRAGIEEAKILDRRRPIATLLADSATPPELRHKLALAVQARTFAREALRLDVGGSYTTYAPLDRDTLLLVLSAARKDRFEPVTWWFPIVGRVAYKGFFDPDDARREAERLERRGYDTYLRPSSAFSTLGWLDDPLLSSLLRSDDVDLVSTVIHELTHNTLYLPSQASFNESFASFVGDRGAIAFFCALEGDDGPRCRLARDRWHDSLLFARFLTRLIAELEALYARPDLATPDRLALREEIFRRARDRFRDEVAPRLATDAYRGFPRATLNNASLIARRLYYDRLDLFEAAFHRHGQDLRATVHAILAEARATPGQPFAALARLATR